MEGACTLFVVQKKKKKKMEKKDRKLRQECLICFLIRETLRPPSFIILKTVCFCHISEVLLETQLTDQLGFPLPCSAHVFIVLRLSTDLKPEVSSIVFGPVIRAEVTTRVYGSIRNLDSGLGESCHFSKTSMSALSLSKELLPDPLPLHFGGQVRLKDGNHQ